MVEEVEAGEVFDFVHASDVVTHGVSSVLVFIEETDGFCFASFADEHHFEESIRHRHVVLAHRTSRLMDENGTCHDVNLSIRLRPIAAFLLQFLPVVLVEVAVLRTDVGHEKGVVLCLLRPFVVGSRAHVTSLIAAPAFTDVAVECARLRHVLIFQELFQTRIGTVGVGCRQRPTDPCRAARLGIVGGDVGVALQQHCLFRRFGSVGGDSVKVLLGQFAVREGSLIGFAVGDSNGGLFCVCSGRSEL